MSAVLTPGRAAALPDRCTRRRKAAAETTAIDANRAWEIDRALMLERSERRAWWVAIAGLVLGLIGIAAVFVQGPLRRVVEIPIVVDRVTGETTIQQRLSVETIPPMEALDKHNLATFVRAREGYSWMFLQRDFDQVARMAVPAVFADYNRQFEGDGALQKKIGAAEDWRINVVGVRLAASGRSRQQGRGHRHLRQGRAPDRPQPAGCHHPACRQRRLPVPAQGAGQGTRPAGEPVRLRRHGLPLRPRDQHGRHRGPSHEAPGLRWLRCAGLRRCWPLRRRRAEPPTHDFAKWSTTRSAVVTVPVKRGVVTLVVLDADEVITEVAAGLGGDCAKPDAAWCMAAQPGGRNLSSRPRARPAPPTTWPSSPTGAPTVSLRGPRRRRPASRRSIGWWSRRPPPQSLPHASRRETCSARALPAVPPPPSPQQVVAERLQAKPQ